MASSLDDGVIFVIAQCTSIYILVQWRSDLRFHHTPDTKTERIHRRPDRRTRRKTRKADISYHISRIRNQLAASNPILQRIASSLAREFEFSSLWKRLFEKFLPGV